MRIFALLLLVIASGCHCRSEIQASFDPKCFTSCYGGAESQAGVGACNMGTWQCEDAESEPVCVNWGSPTEEVCNGKDDDCDGQLDEVVDVCMAQCGWGVRTCRAGEWTQCSGAQPKDEVCNGLDDDCDGQIDEVTELPVEPCYTGNNSELTVPFGDCHPGTYKCEAGHQVCRNQKLPSSEVCDNVDNNCNGTVDEDIGGCSNGQASQGIDIRAAWNIVNDIDLHLLHPDAGDSHDLTHWAVGANGLDCFYANRTPDWDIPDAGGDNPTLDHDVIQGTGTEAITMLRPIIGHKYTIGLYSYNWSAAPNIVSAAVKVYCGGILMTTQTHDFARQGEMWVAGTVEYINQNQCVFTFDGHVMPDGGV